MEAENDVSTTQHADSHQKLEGMDPLPECAEHGTTDILTLDFRTVREYISVGFFFFRLFLLVGG